MQRGVRRSSEELLGIHAKVSIYRTDTAARQAIVDEKKKKKKCPG